MNYPDSVIPIISILKSLSFFDYSTRKNLSTDSNVLLNIIRSTYIHIYYHMSLIFFCFI